jgi:hypothetical protein
MISPEMKRIIYVLRSALELKSSKTSHAIHTDEFVADFEVVYPSSVDPNAIDFMIQSLIADTEEREMLEKFAKEREFTPFIVRNTNSSALERGVGETQKPTKEQRQEQQKLFPVFQLRSLFSLSPLTAVDDQATALCENPIR